MNAYKRVYFILFFILFAFQLILVFLSLLQMKLSRAIPCLYQFFFFLTAFCHLPNATHCFVLFSDIYFSILHQILLFKLFSFLIAYLCRLFLQVWSAHIKERDLWRFLFLFSFVIYPGRNEYFKTLKVLIFEIFSFESGMKVLDRIFKNNTLKTGRI